MLSTGTGLAKSPACPVIAPPPPALSCQAAKLGREGGTPGLEPGASCLPCVCVELAAGWVNYGD